jgi:hypothetical protein
MKKTLLALLSATLLFTVISPAQAEDQKVLAVIDTAINSDKHPAVIYEACFTLNKTCPNATNFMEGKGSASAVVWAKSVNDSIYHGDAMVKAALVANPNVKIVFIRFYDVTSLGNSSAQADSLVRAIDWVSKNADKYSIDAVSISQSNIKNPALCTDKTTVNAVLSMSKKNIPTFASTGNDGSKTVVGFPACVSGVIGVGALSSQSDGGVMVGETATNRGPGLDVVALGNIAITKYNGSPTDLAGSSGANVVSAATYIKKNIYNTSLEYVNSLPKQSVKFVDYFIINLDKTKTIVWEPVRLVSTSSM